MLHLLEEAVRERGRLCCTNGDTYTPSDRLEHSPRRSLLFTAVSSTGKEAVVKFPLRGYEDDDCVSVDLAAYAAELAALSTVRHRNVVDLRGCGNVHFTNGRFPFLVLERIRGTSLGQVFEKGPLSEYRAAHVTRQICGALQHTHERHVVHRDVKPENILSGPRGAKLIDYGLSGTGRDLDPWQAAGTPSYMSPEQASCRVTDGRADVYSLGITLFCAVTGRKPFVGPVCEIFRQHREQPVADPREYTSALTKECAEVIRRATEKNPDDRYQTAAEMGAALADVLKRSYARGVRSRAG